MTNRWGLHRTALVLASWLLLCVPATASAQDALSRAKGFYASAEYEEALQLLETLKGKAANTEAAAYQVFCLVALGRRDEARTVIETIVRTDPLYRPSEIEVSPRIRAFFDDVRKPLLPEVARQSYARAKAAFDKKDWAQALGEFDRVIALLDEVGGTDQGVADLRVLAAGFRDLTTAAFKLEPVAPAPTPTPAPVAPPPAPAAPQIYGDEDTGVTRPVSIVMPLPDWRPDAVEAHVSFSGTMAFVVTEQGKVLSPTLVKSVHPRYDALLLEAAKTWSFQPATKGGVPVRYRYLLTVNLAAR